MTDIYVTVLWHTVFEFYNVRVPRLMGTVSNSVMRMRSKIYNVEGVNWKYHTVLTLSEESVKSCKKNGGVDNKMIRSFMDKVKGVYGKDVKYFWKYEEGRESGRSHFHLLLDVNETEETEKKIESLIIVGSKENYIKMQRNYDMNKNKTDNEIVKSYCFYKFWNKGIVNAREIKNQKELVDQVERDIAKITEVKSFKNKKKWGFSKGLIVKKRKPSEYEWRGKVNYLEALDLLEETKENFVEYFESRNLDGAIVYARTVGDLNKYVKNEEGKILVQEKIYPEEKFDIDKLLTGAKKVIRNE